MHFTLCTKLKFKWYLMNPENSIKFKCEYRKNNNSHCPLPYSVVLYYKLSSMQKNKIYDYLHTLLATLSVHKQANFIFTV